MSRQNIPFSALKSTIYTLRCLPKRNACLAYLLQDGFAICQLFFFMKSKVEYLLFVKFAQAAK